jgi:hypothetical protein
MSTNENAPKSAAELKRERELAARKALFTQGDARPANTDLSTLLGEAAGQGSAEAASPTAQAQEPAAEPSAAAPVVEETPAVEPSPPEPASAPAVPAEAPAPAVRVAKAAKAPKTAPAKPAAQPEPDAGPLPWETSDVMPKGFTTKFPADLHAKMNWIIDNVPRQSIQKIVHAATREYVERIIAEVYKP